MSKPLSKKKGCLGAFVVLVLALTAWTFLVPYSFPSNFLRFCYIIMANGESSAAFEMSKEIGRGGSRYFIMRCLFAGSQVSSTTVSSAVKYYNERHGENIELNKAIVDSFISNYESQKKYGRIFDHYDYIGYIYGKREKINDYFATKAIEIYENILTPEEKYFARSGLPDNGNGIEFFKKELEENKKKDLKIIEQWKKHGKDSVNWE